MKHIYLLTFIIAIAACTNSSQSSEEERNDTVEVGTLEIVAELDINPGNVTVSNDGRIFASVHPMRGQDVQLIEISENNSYQAFPDEEFQSPKDEKSADKLDTPLGVIFDKKNRLWAIDAGLNIGQSRVFAFDIEGREVIYRFDIPSELAPSSSFVQDLAIDEENGFVYLADFGDPGIIVLNLNDSTFRKIKHPTMAAEDIDMVINDEVLLFNGAPARIGINPITLSDDRETVYYGAMSGTRWYSLSATDIRNEATDEEVLNTLTTVGSKPLSDGVATDENENHYFTNLQNSSIDVLDENGLLTTLKKDALLDWPDNVRIHEDWLYIAVNQLHKAPAFTGGEEKSTLPFRIVRVKFR